MKFIFLITAIILCLTLAGCQDTDLTGSAIEIDRQTTTEKTDSTSTSTVTTTSIPQLNSVCYNDQCFKVETAVTFEEQTKGLMGRVSMPEDAGMLFVFGEDGYYRFWMKYTKIPLDIIWLDKEGKVVYISRNTPPCIEETCPEYFPEDPSRYVLEVNAGICDKIGLIEGEYISFDVEI